MEKQKFLVLFSECNNTYKVYSSYRSHLSRCHSGVFKSEKLKCENNDTNKIIGRTVITEDTETTLTAAMNSFDGIENDCNNYNETSNCPESVGRQFEVDVAQFYLNLQSKYFIPKTVMSEIIDGFVGLHATDINMLRQKLSNVFCEQGMDSLQTKLILDEVFSHDFLLKLHKPDGPFRSTYSLSSYYRSNFNFIENLITQENSVVVVHIFIQSL